MNKTSNELKQDQVSDTLINKIEWAELTAEISSRIGYPAELGTRVHIFNKDCLLFSTDNLKDHDGIPAPTRPDFRINKSKLDEVTIGGFGEVKNRTPENKPYLWLPINVNWKFEDGGRFGNCFLKACYEFDIKGWSFK